MHTGFGAENRTFNGETANENSAGGTSTQKRKILVVEDDFMLAMSMEHTLEGGGFEVAGVAPDAATAIRLATQTRPDLVVMDVRLKGEMDGVAAAVEIWRWLRIRSLFVTGNADIAESPRAAPANAAGVISKPYRDADVLSAIGQALGTAQA